MFLSLLVIIVERFRGGFKILVVVRDGSDIYFGAVIKNLNRLNSSRTEESKRKQFVTILIFL